MTTPDTPDTPGPDHLTADERGDQLLYGEVPPASPTERRERVKAALVELIESGCNLSEACEAMRINRSTAFRWRQADPAFAEAISRAPLVSVDVLKREAERRALRGSDKLLMFLLERYSPEQFHLAQKLEHSGAVDLASAVIAARRRVQPPAGEPDWSDLC